MKRLFNTLYVMTQGAYLSKDGETVSVMVENETKLRVPVHTLDGIVCMGQVSCSPPLMCLCAEHNVTVTFMSQYGKFLARVQGAVSGNVLLRREQYRKADDPVAAGEIARAMVIAKVANSRTVLLRAARDHPEREGIDEVDEAAAILARILDDLRDSRPLDHVRGLEGEAAKVYFGVFNHLITAQKDSFVFQERNRRPPLDRMNALLSFIYTLLVHDASSALEAVGLDPAVGFLHRDRPGRPSLSLDLIEEVRSYLGDRLALTLVNRQQIKALAFTTTETGAVLMDDDTRKTLLAAFQQRKQEEIRHPFLDEPMPAGLLLHVQARLLARFIRGDLDGYPPFLLK